MHNQMREGVLHRHYQYPSIYTGASALGYFHVDLSTNGGSTWTTLESITVSLRDWVLDSFGLQGLVPITRTMRLRFVVDDTGIGSVTEAAVDEVRILDPTSGVEQGSFAVGRGASVRLLGILPNPFRRSTVIRCEIPEGGPSRLVLFDVSGREVRLLEAASEEPGITNILWDGRDNHGRPVPAGLYFCRLEQGRRHDEGRVLRVF